MERTLETIDGAQVTVFLSELDSVTYQFVHTSESFHESVVRCKLLNHQDLRPKFSHMAHWRCRCSRETRRKDGGSHERKRKCEEQSRSPDEFRSGASDGTGSEHARPLRTRPSGYDPQLAEAYGDRTTRVLGLPARTNNG